MANKLTESLNKKCKALEEMTICATLTNKGRKDLIDITVDGNIEPQMRHRDRSRGSGKYDPMSKYKGIFKKKVMDQLFMFKEPTTRPVHLEIKYTIEPIGMSELNRYKALSQEILPTKKPDLDNITKLIQDTFNGVLYADDSQICSVSVEKVYGKMARTDIRFTILNDKNNFAEKGKRCTKALREYYEMIINKLERL